MYTIRLAKQKSYYVEYYMNQVYQVYQDWPDCLLEISLFLLSTLLLDALLRLFGQPFFLPVSMHVLLAALREWKRYKQEKAKYTAWKAKVKVKSWSLPWPEQHLVIERRERMQRGQQASDGKFSQHCVVRHSSILRSEHYSI